jgi:phenylacetate-CoA ligase
VKLASYYGRLPIPLQNVACSFRGWQIERTTYGPGFAEALAAAEERAAWSQDRLAAYRDERLRGFVRHAAETVPYYRRLFAEGGLDPAAIRGLDDLATLPTLTKEAVRERPADFLSDAVPADARIVRRTGGTTGSGLMFATTRPALQVQEAAYWRFRRRLGIDRGTWCAFFSGYRTVPPSQRRPPYWRLNYPGRQIFLSTAHMSSDTLPAYADLLRKRRPPWLHGYPSALALLASHVLAGGRDLGYVPRAVTTGAETLLPHQRLLLERAFGVRPRERYVMAECVAGAAECEEGLLHLDEDLAATELVPAGEEGVFRVVGTNFTNLAMPLLRYQTFDLVHAAAGPCPCGRGGRALESIDGRIEDYVVAASGALVGRLSMVFHGLTSIREAQFLQERPGAVTIRVVVDPSFGRADEGALVAAARARLGDDTEIAVERVASLPRAASGKLRMVVSSLPSARL